VSAIAIRVRALEVLRHFGIPIARRDGRVVSVRQCPACGKRATAAVAIDLDGGRWFDEARGCRGELVDLVAGYAGRKRGDDLEDVLETIRIAGDDGTNTAGTGARR
jgi:hypothetical protein